MIRVREYLCNIGHRTEHFIKGEAPDYTDCPHCGGQAQRVMSAPRTMLEGVTGDFPGAAMQWERKRAEKQAVQERKLRDHGDEGWTY